MFRVLLKLGSARWISYKNCECKLPEPEQSVAPFHPGKIQKARNMFQELFLKEASTKTSSCFFAVVDVTLKSLNMQLDKLK